MKTNVRSFKVSIGFLTIFAFGLIATSSPLNLSIQKRTSERHGGYPRSQSAGYNYSPGPTVSDRDCQILATVLTMNKVDGFLNWQADDLLGVIYTACGLARTEGYRLENFQPVFYDIPSLKLQILWDGSKVSLNEKALATIEFTTPASFSNRHVITEDQIKYAREASPNEAVTTDSGNSVHKVESNTKCSGFTSCLKRRLQGYKDYLQEVRTSGERHLIFSGIAHHSRDHYTPEKLSELNERAWGIGVEQVRFTPEGHRESVAALVISDSHADPQFSVTYERQYRIFSSLHFAGYAGFTAGLVARSDFKYIPLPFLFPSATVRVGRVNLKTVYIPNIGGGVNNGAVLFLFGSMKI